MKGEPNGPGWTLLPNFIFKEAKSQESAYTLQSFIRNFEDLSFSCSHRTDLQHILFKGYVVTSIHIRHIPLDRVE
jgi:hypothetical protein